MRQLLRRCLMLWVLLVPAAAALACSICAPASGSDTLLFQLHAADAVALAAPAPGSSGLALLQVVKGEGPRAVTPTGWLGAVDQASADQPVLLLYSAVNHSWRARGRLGSQRADWLRRLAAMPLPAAVAPQQWPQRLAFFARDLEDPQALVAQTAYEEISVAPYSALRGLKAAVDAGRLRGWVEQPQLAERRPLYLLLLGVSGSTADLPRLERLMRTQDPAQGSNALSAMLAAYLELGGKDALDWVVRNYLTDGRRTQDEVQAAVLALAVHGADGVRLERSQVVRAYASLIAGNPRMAGLAASDLANRGHREFGAAYAGILRSGQPLAFAARYAMVFYLLRNPDPQVRSTVEALRAEQLL